MLDWSRIRASLLGETSDRQLMPDLRLPVLPKAVSEFTEIADEPDCSVGDLAAIVETDSGLTCQLLRNVNASANGLTHRVSSVQHSISLLGIKRTKLFLITAALQSALPIRQLKVVNLATFWNTNLERAYLAKKLAALLKTDQELAFAAALLQDFLLPVLTNERDREYVDFLRGQESEPCDLTRFEQDVFGWDHAEAGARVMFDWKFPDELICCVLVHHRGLSMLADEELGKSPAAAVALAGLMPDALRQSPLGLSHLVQLSDRWSEFDLMTVSEEVFEQAHDQMHHAENHIPFRDWCAKTLEMADV